MIVRELEKRDNSHVHTFRFWYAISLAWQFGFIIMAPLVGSLFLGSLADRFFQTQPIFLLVGLLIGMIVMIYEGYHALSPFFKQHDTH